MASLAPAVPSSKTNQQEDGKFIPSNENVLQKHVAFFDRNHDGIVYPWETFQGFRAIGCGIPLSTGAALFINMGLSSKTRPGKFPSLLFPIEIKNIHKSKHGSDSGVYDSEGRFVPSKFEEIFTKHACTQPNALTSDELMGMLKANREPKDYGGWVAAYSEWKILYVLCKDKNGLLRKDTVKAVYDGSLFEHMEKEHESAKKKAAV
ncbi:putative peroxygenase 4 [Citrus sinensis]|uniref:Peroxygenase 4 n=3 Tax=Citrus TaxID=2706 RepID=A0ACB8N9Z9_CITSI|nr:putative peroxygenase 4 [Citrus sinensis]